MVILWIVSDDTYQGSSRGELEMEPWKGEEQSKQNSSWVLSVPTWNLLEQTKTKRTLGHSLQGTAADKGPRPRSPMSGSLFHTCQTPIRRHIVPHINEHPLPGKGTLTYSNKATSRQTPTREGRWMAKWPAYTKRHMPRSACPPPPISLIPHGWVIRRLVSGFPCPSEWFSCPCNALHQLHQPGLGLLNYYSLPDTAISWA